MHFDHFELQGRVAKSATEAQLNVTRACSVTFSSETTTSRLLARPLGAGALTFGLTGTKKCLDLPGGNAIAGQLLQLWDCNGLQNQKWRFDPGSWQISYAANTGLCVDNLGGGSAGNKLGLWGCSGGSNQKWGYDSNEGTVYLADSVTDASLCMDVPGDSTANGNAIQIWGCNGLPPQQWTVGQPSPPSPSPGGGCYAKNAISADQLSCVFSKLSAADAARYSNDLNSWMGDSLTNACKWAAFLANVGTESAGLTEWTQAPCSNPFCGRGPLQITGSSNYNFCARQGVCKCADIGSNPTEVSNDENTGMGTASCVWKVLSGHDLSTDADGSRDPGLLRTACYINAGHYPCGTPNGWQSRQN